MGLRRWLRRSRTVSPPDLAARPQMGSQRRGVTYREYHGAPRKPGIAPREGRAAAPEAGSSRVVARLDAARALAVEAPAPIDVTAVWIPFGQPARAGAVTIAGGGIYFGRGLRAIGRYWQPEPALVDPSLPTNFAEPDWLGSDLTYWPSYHQLTPAGRAAYLSWLSSPRNWPQTPIGYVFLYFYGLERRAFVDALTSPAVWTEVPLVEAEVERLQRIYGSNHSFSGYASEFLSTLRCLLEPPGVPTHPPPFVENHTWEIPPYVKLGLARFVAAGHPIPADWALAWVLAQPEMYLRTPAHRCGDELSQLFALRYRKRFGDGLVVKPNKSRLKIGYRPASGGFGQTVDIPVESLPDVSALTAPVRVLHELAKECTGSLDSYSRWLGRHPEDRGSLAATALLPTELARDASGGALNELFQWLDLQLSDRSYAVVEGVKLVLRWPAQTPGKLTRSEASALAQLLSARGYGVEPDVRFAGPILGAGMAVIFRLDGAGASAGADWESAAAVLQLVAAVAAPGVSSDDVLELVAEQLQAALDLPPTEHNRVLAHLRWAAISPPNFAAAKRALEATNSAAREGIATLLIDVAAAHGGVGPEQVSALTKAYRALRLEPTAMYSRIHERTARPVLEPVEVRVRRDGRPGEPVPPPPPIESATAITINQEAIRAKLAESARAAALLGQIFADDDEDDGSPAHAEPGRSSPLSGAHAELLRNLATRRSWSHAEFAALASRTGLLPAGAMETLNDASMERHGEPVMEGDDVITMNPDALKELLP